MSRMVKEGKTDAVFIEAPDTEMCAEKIFGVKFNAPIPAFSRANDYVPESDPDYFFDPDTTRAILAGFAYNKRVFIHGFHGTGKSTHIEQVAARLNWSCVRLNLDSQIGRSDLVGRDAIILRDGKQVTEFKEGILPWAMRRPCALVFDEYDAGRPDIMFVIQRLLEEGGKLTLPDGARQITPHPYFRIFATANTVGSGDATGLYHGTQQINQGQMDRWSLTVSLNYIPPEREAAIILAKTPHYNYPEGRELIKNMVNLAGLIRAAFKRDEIGTIISPRTLIAWAENALIFDDVALAFRLSFLNRCDESDHVKIAEFYQRCFGEDLSKEATEEAPHANVA